MPIRLDFSKNVGINSYLSDNLLSYFSFLVPVERGCIPAGWTESSEPVRDCAVIEFWSQDGD